MNGGMHCFGGDKSENFLSWSKSMMDPVTTCDDHWCDHTIIQSDEIISQQNDEFMILQRKCYMKLLCSWRGIITRALYKNHVVGGIVVFSMIWTSQELTTAALCIVAVYDSAWLVKLADGNIE